MAKLYYDVDIVERTEITREGTIEKVYRVSAYTSSDIRFSIDVKQADFNKVKVDELLNKKSTQLEEIKAL